MSPRKADTSGAVPTWTAGAVARMLAMPASTLRAWHHRYRLPLTGPQTGAHRRYTRADIDALLRMKHLVERGHSTESAARLAFHPARGTTSAEDLVAAATELDTETIIAVLDAHFSAHGVTATWTKLCCPALTALDDPTAPDAGHCVDLVHALSWAITAALHRIPTPATTGSIVLLACVDGERHTLPLEALRAALAQHGVPACLLGASLPWQALIDATERITPTALVLWNSTGNTADIPAALADQDTRLVLAGPDWTGAPVPPKAFHPDTLADAVHLLTRSTGATELLVSSR
jgi:DNA-binding transcriptional MerR regulator